MVQQCFCCEDGCDDRQALSKWKLEVRIHLFFNLFVFLGSSVALSSSSVILSSVVVSLLGSQSGAFFISVAAYLTSSLNSPQSFRLSSRLPISSGMLSDFSIRALDILITVILSPIPKSVTPESGCDACFVFTDCVCVFSLVF